ncbi:outer envelope pore protein 16-4, chloroplastic-like [Primulina tabacum]|uniref:outer envelope pore protein 16-4, chloroplastic-like n=1 Tax=Primulina tabacum TaxID=48773 RepID=UPI003F5987E9
MEGDLSDSVPCSSIPVNSVIRVSSVNSNPHNGFQWGLFAAIFSFAHCGIQRYRRRKDWVNALAAGAVAGAAYGAGTRKWKQIAGITGLYCTIFQFADNSKSVWYIVSISLQVSRTIPILLS